ncbi:hypothetical protein AXE65_12265 [Ventosimonas gracilis]|uniref:Protein-arginine rhamnosyltransferase n=1 Tax=Ventosimonas gracilis TaxID=1680762 RepID=A0A139SWA7_9GAMM|nr:elongation factor P maturation arginine rhamnosyltransferase EarP [Ventosimonas gracilis]KXU38720.1 hypothetical protein AXE65_12265 [Ventosimonas gracilis]
MKTTWDIFCRVIDNYGDIGITWRLSRQLVAEYGQQVRLWVDDLNAFAKLCPAANSKADCQWQSGVQICRWPRAKQSITPAQIVIEAFACRLPDFVEAAMADGAGRLWLNLEYLSAEDWVEDCHEMPSPQEGGVLKYFFFPGFSEKTGGLLRERDLLQQRLIFGQDPSAQKDFLAGLGVCQKDQARLISLFSYENPAIADWLQALSQDSQPNQLLVPEGRILENLASGLDTSPLRAGQNLQRGNLSLHVLPFVDQKDYDRLLWCCDFNLVRGEDSFLRAQWAGRPMLWHIYPQQDNAHSVKLEAFLARYLQQMPVGSAQELADFWRAWNTGQPLAANWQRLLAHWEALQKHAQRWANQQASHDDLAAKLVQFCRARVS